ncbi:MAG: bifunctional oligoribonuclease/PAP phosphatase NrnA [Bacteroidetes bacterium]|jgi:phosphoesterase RecJ-like protein|nr:bifunctional oligoribonuclease/PAP phosphatase NrnA [Bacteroidota bacterium]
MNNNQLTLHFDKAMVRERIKNARSICILSHRNPDGDAIGSALALYHLLKKWNKKVNVVLPNFYPDFLGWIPGANHIHIIEKDKKRADEFINEADVLFFLDFNTESRISEVIDTVNKSKALKIHIDHHPHPDIKSDVMINITAVSSTAELLYWTCLELDWLKEMDTIIATCFYVGIMTDTGCFSHNASARSTFVVISELLANNIDNEDIYYKIYNNYSFNRMKLLGYCLNEKLEHIPELNTAFISINAEELERFNYQVGDTEGFVNYPLSIQGVRFSVLFTEKDNLVKISLRSKGDFAVNKFSATHFNGGGHMNAAGGSSKLSLSDTLVQFREVLKEYAHELSD